MYRPVSRAAALAALFIASSTLSPAPAHAGSLLLISLDGMAPRYVLEADKAGTKIPNLQSFLKDGTYATGVAGVTPTLTYPNHTTMTTGVLPSEHGILSNTPFDPTQKNRDGWYWYANDIRVPTLFSAAHSAHIKSATVNWPVTVGDRNIDTLLPEYWRVSNTEDLKLIRALSRPEGRMEQLEAKLGNFVDGNTDTLESDEVRTRFALSILKEDRPQFIAVHLIALDGTEHANGPFTPEAYHVIEALDRMVGELTAAALANDRNTTVAIVSDHGFFPVNTAVNLRTAFVKDGWIKLKTQTSPDAGATVDAWTAQVWPAGGSAAIVLANPSDSAARENIAKRLTQLSSDKRNGIARVLDANELKKAGAFPDATFLVEFAPGFYAGTNYRGDLLTPGTSKGTHGYLPERPEMHASFLIKGPGVAPSKDLGVVNMRQIAPTLAQVLAVRLPTAREKPLPIYVNDGS